MDRYVLVPNQLAALERCLSVVCKAEKWLTYAGIFWLGKSFFVANQNAWIGLADSGIELEPKGCIAITPQAARSLYAVLHSHTVRFITDIEMEARDCGDTVKFLIHYQKTGNLKDRTIVSRYGEQWFPGLGIGSRYKFFQQRIQDSEYELNVEKVLCSLRNIDDTFLPVEKLIPIGYAFNYVIDIGVLKSFLAPARSEDTTMLIGYCGPAYPLLAKAGDVIAILNAVPRDRKVYSAH
jgi:hypothetical protein